MSDLSTKKNHIRFLPALAVFALVCFIRHFKFTMSTYNTTFFALNYDYGFIPRGFVGTCFKYITQHYEKISWNYMGVFNFNGVFTLVYFVLLFIFFALCLYRCVEESQRNLKHLVVFLSIFAFPMFTNSVNYGSLDLYLNIVLILGLILMILEKCEWLIIPLGVLGMCINHDFIFTHAMLIGILLVYKLLNHKGKSRIKYGIILLLFLISLVSMFSHFENYTYENPKEIATEIKTSAKALSETGKSYGKTYVKEEILGEDLSLTEERIEQNEDNLQDLPVFTLLFSPYLAMMFYLFLRLFTDAGITWNKRISYMALLLGSIAIVPMLMHDVYYGRYMFQLVFYYIVAFIAILAFGDVTVETHFTHVKADMKKLTPMTFVWFVYPFLLTPFRAVAISAPIHKLAEILSDPELTFFIQP